MKLSTLFPAEFRAFYCGPLSMCVERFGGINSISLLDIRQEGERSYPDRFPIPWLSRNGGTMGRPLYSPGLMFYHDGQQFVPENAELHPFGFRSREYSLAMSRSAIGIRLAAHAGELFTMTLSALHMPEGQMLSLKNQLAVLASGIQWLPAEMRGEGFDCNLPFPEGDMELKREPLAFHGNELVFEADCRYADCSKRQFWVIRLPGEAQVRNITNGWAVELTMGTEPLELCFGFGDSLEQARKQAGNDFETLFQEGLKTCEEALQADFEDLPEATEFFQLYPGYQRNLILAESERELSTRAAADKYGLFVLWDQIYPARDFLLLGEPERTKKSLRYVIAYPWAETCPWITIQLIPAVGEYLAFHDDPDFLRECMPYFRKFLDFNLTFTDERTGLLLTSLNCGTDCSKEAGLEGLFYPSCLNGWWYDSLRTLENLALDVGDDDLALRCRNLSQMVDDHYAKAFFDEREGYLRAARKQDGTLPDVDVYQNTHTLAMDYAYGAYLFRNILPQLADYQATRLYHPMGHVAVANDSQVPCEMWKSVHMNQHLGHECKTARLGGRAPEAQRVMAGYLDYFHRYQCAIETFNLAGCPGDASQLANWQAFSATGAAQGLLTGVAGWQKHRGGWTWLPGQGTASQIRNLDGKSFHVTGDGAWASGVSVDEQLVQGTLQVPIDRPGRDYSIVRQNAEPSQPLLLFVVDTPVSSVQTTQGRLSFRVERASHACICAYSPVKPGVTCNGALQDIEWNERTKLLWWDRAFQAGDEIVIAEN